MFDTKKFGGYLSRLRKNADMTQAELADRLGLTERTVSKYESGESFPDGPALLLIAGIFGVTPDKLISSGEPTAGEAEILNEIVAGGGGGDIRNVFDLLNLAPLLKPSILAKLSVGLGRQGIDISNIVALAEYLSDSSVIEMLEGASFDTVDSGLLERLIPLLDERSKETIFQKILDGAIDWHLISILMPYAEYMISQVEAAVIEGALPWEALEVMNAGLNEVVKKKAPRNNKQ